MSSTSDTPDPSPRAFFQVLKLHQLVHSTLEVALAPQGLTPPQYTALSLIRHHQPVSPAELSRKLGITTQSTGETVKALETRGLITRAPIPNNKRSIALLLTEAGRQALSAADRVVADAEQRFFSRLSPAARQRLLVGIRVLRDGEHSASPPAGRPQSAAE
jgi:DNA-binding MarR family transcriptional regulator